MNKRSVHGGADSHLSIEVSPVRMDGGWVETCAAYPDRAEAFAVYIRNPLAFHIRDFELPSGARPTVWGVNPEIVAREQGRASRRAFTYADGLAVHLGCDVVSSIPRPLSDLELAMAARDIVRHGGGSGPDFFAYDDPDGFGHVVVTAMDGGEASDSDWLVATYAGALADGQDDALYTLDSVSGEAFAVALDCAFDAMPSAGDDPCPVHRMPLSRCKCGGEG